MNLDAFGFDMPGISQNDRTALHINCVLNHIPSHGTSSEGERASLTANGAGNHCIALDGHRACIVNSRAGTLLEGTIQRSCAFELCNWMSGSLVAIVINFVIGPIQSVQLVFRCQDERICSCNLRLAIKCRLTMSSDDNTVLIFGARSLDISLAVDNK